MLSWACARVRGRGEKLNPCHEDYYFVRVKVSKPLKHSTQLFDQLKQIKSPSTKLNAHINPTGLYNTIHPKLVDKLKVKVKDSNDTGDFTEQCKIDLRLPDGYIFYSQKFIIRDDDPGKLLLTLGYEFFKKFEKVIGKNVE